MDGAVAKAKHVNKTAKIDAQYESRSSKKRDKLAADPYPGQNFCLVVSAQYRESFGMSCHKGTLRP
jgi:hypothetical protein